MKKKKEDYFFFEEEFASIDQLNFISQTEINRREFIKFLGGGIIIVFSAGSPFFKVGQRGTPSDINAYLKIGEDGSITCYSGKVEMGQGIITSLAQMAAEELDVDIQKVEMVLGDTDLCPPDRGTWGSLTTRQFGPALRAAAAEAKAIMINIAAEKMNIPHERLTVKNGVVVDRNNSSNKLTYGEIALGQKITRKLGRRAMQKAVSEFTVMQKPHTRRDGKVKVTGEALYTGDIRLPGMLYAKILRPPVHGATRKSLDTSEARAMEGVTVIEDGELVAVLSADPETAEKGLDRIKAEWDVPKQDFDHDSIYEYLMSKAPGRGDTADSAGTVAAGTKQSDKVFEHKYYNAYVAHAPMEPHSAMADVKEDKATLWISTQAPFRHKDTVASMLGLNSQNVQVIAPFLGGGFGGKSSGRQVLEAARLSKAVGKPVQVVFDRAEEFFYDTFRPACQINIKSGTDANGKMTLWDYHVYYAGTRGSDQFYDVPNYRINSYGTSWRGGRGDNPHPFAVGAWRAPAANNNTFAREQQIDIMAADAGIDPVEFRLNNIKDKRMRKVLESAAEKFGWTRGVAPSGRGFGVSLGVDAGAYVGAIAEVDVNKRTGKVQVKRVVCAQDIGVVVNPEGATIQVEGCITMGLGYALAEGLRFRGGAVLDKNFGTYRIPRFSWVPEIETVLVENKALSPQGGGEPAIVNMGAVIANAIYDATGARIYHMPMTEKVVRDAIRSLG